MVWLSPYFQRPLAAKLCARPPKVLEVQECARGSLSPCQVWWGSDFTRRRGGQRVFLAVCLFVRHAFERQTVRPISPWRRWRTETILMPLDSGRFVVVHPCSTFSDCCQLATEMTYNVFSGTLNPTHFTSLGNNTKCWSAKNGKNCFFFANRGRQNKPIETIFGT